MGRRPFFETIDEAVQECATIARWKSVIHRHKELLEVGIHHDGRKLGVNARLKVDVVNQLLLVLLRLYLLGNGGQEVLQQLFILDVTKTLKHLQQFHPPYLQGLLEWNRLSPLRLTQESHMLRETVSLGTGDEPSAAGVGGSCDAGNTVSSTRESDVGNGIRLLERMESSTPDSIDQSERTLANPLFQKTIESDGTTISVLH